MLLALPNAPPEAVDAYIVTRREALDAGMPVPPFAPAQGFGAGAVPVWRIRAEANTADGVTFVREAVVRPSGDPRLPLIVLLWQDGISAGTPGMVADGKTDATGKAPPNTPNQNGRS